MADDSWRTPAFRQSVVAKIDEAIRQSGMNTSRNSIEMENHVFQKAKNKEEYLSFVARLILHVREMNTKKGQAGMNGHGQQQGAPGMPDPINALQNLASQGSRNPMVGMGGPQTGQMGGPAQGPATNLLQTLNRGPGQQIMMGTIPGSMPMQVHQNIGMQSNNAMGGQMGGQMPGQMPMQMQGQSMGPISGQLAGQMQNTVGPPGQMGGQLPGQMQMGGGMQGPMNNQMMAGIQQLQQQKPQGQNPMMMNPNAMAAAAAAAVAAGGFPRQPTPTQMFTQSPLPPSAQSPAGGSGGMNVGQPPVASPALAPSPGAQMGMMTSTGGPPRSVNMAPSPSSASLNTPGQPGQSPISAGGAMTDEQAYREKVRQLSKYIEPLRKMIAKMGNDDVEKMSKMKKLLEILSNPHQRMPLDTLIKCEIVLEKIDFKRGDNSVPTTAAPHLPFKEPHVFHSLLDAVSQNLQSPVINHTLHRTFGPTLDALFGPEMKLVPPLKKAKIEEPTSDIPDVLQGEIARLDQRFKVSLDPNQQPGSKSIHLICYLDDKHLPCVPPISLTVPEGYPKVSPTCHVTPHEYTATKFLTNVQTALQARIQKLPKYFSVSQLLDTWEMSVRQASAPSSTPVDALTILLGL
ncbi:mediator of RNA polymerase II transcription subunit 15 isoform X2 [Cylas formicarius]|uniref:mediator of RNA polymerase II transcription subunit 15 isoform X2 n=1 Tax=Cylas formicarius TaxID=197179 RepID=UPI0029588E22|nr:mediator of RNA polymerase II transcription subunit 15 isoform X2 [Cylas formicarius]